MLTIKPGAAGWEARMLPLCYAAPIFSDFKSDWTPIRIIRSKGKRIKKTCSATCWPCPAAARWSLSRPRTRSPALAPGSWFWKQRHLISALHSWLTSSFTVVLSAVFLIKMELSPKNRQGSIFWCTKDKLMCSCWLEIYHQVTAQSLVRPREYANDWKRALFAPRRY